MPYALFDWVPALATRLGTITGIKQVFYPHPTNANAWVPGVLQPQDFPCFLIEIVDSPLTYSAGGPGIYVHRVRLTLFVAEKMLAEAHGYAMSFIDLTAAKLAGQMKLGLADDGSGGVDHILPDSKAQSFYEGPGGIKLGSNEHEGIRFNLEVKEKRNYTVAA